MLGGRGGEKGCVAEVVKRDCALVWGGRGGVGRM